MFDAATDYNAPATRRTIDDLCNARDQALAHIVTAAARLDAGYRATAEAMEIGKGAFGDVTYDPARFGRASAFEALHRQSFDSEDSVEAARKVIDARTWTHLLSFTGLDRLMDLEERKTFDRGLAEDVPEVTADTVRATLQRLNAERDLIFKRGIANVFARLDRRFRSHDGFKVGSRIILDRAFDDSGHMHWQGRFREAIIDIERVFCELDGGAEGASILDIIQRERPGYGAKQSEHQGQWFEVRVFKNGNAHLWFRNKKVVCQINRLLADYFGDVIPDGMDERAAQDAFRDVKLTPAKRFGFFPSPKPVVDALFDKIYIKPGMRVLEPSAGTGNIARVAVAKGAIVDCIEMQPEHAQSLTNEGIYNRVTCTDFHLINPDAIYDLIVMNPPFDRGRDIDHIMHAFDCLKPGGRLVSVMHAGIEFSETRKAKAFRAFAKRNSFGYGQNPGFTDLPPCSFQEVGTRVNTVIVSLQKPKGEEAS